MEVKVAGDAKEISKRHLAASSKTLDSVKGSTFDSCFMMLQKGLCRDR